MSLSQDRLESILAAEGLHRIDLPMQSVSPRVQQVNAWLMTRPDGSADLYDTGTSDSNSARRICDALADVARLERVVVGHGHSDHSGQALTLRAAWGCTLLAPSGLAGASSAIETARQAFLCAAGATEFEGREATPFRADGLVPVVEGDTLFLGRHTWQAEIQGGHAPNSLLLFSNCGRFLLSADQLLPGIGSFVGVPLKRPLENTLAHQITHLERLALLPREVISLPGHGAPFSNIPAVATSQIASYHRRCVRLLDALDRPATCAALTSAIFHTPTSDTGRMVQLRMAMALCNYLLARGELAISENEVGARVFARTS